MSSEQDHFDGHDHMPEGVESPPPLAHTMAIVRWCILGGMAMFALVMLLGVFGLSPFAQSTSAGTAQYHCPMHPTYIISQPGDCPICGMSLVAIGGGKPTEVASKQSEETFSQAKPGQFTCPMHPEIISDTAGRCPKCNMFLEQVVADTTSQVSTPVAKPGQYTCPMDPEIISDTPGECPTCGMDLELVREGQPAASAMEQKSTVPGLVPVTIESKRLRMIGVQTAVADVSAIGKTKRLTGFVTVDETKLVHIHLRAGGWVTKALVVETGATVKSGDPLLVMYSQDLFAASQEYILARKSLASASGDTAAVRLKKELVEASRYRLYFFGLQPDDVSGIDSSGIPLAELIVRSPVDGYIYEKSINDGQYAGPDATLYSIADQSAVWLIAETYAPELAGIRVGQSAKVSSESSSSESVTARVAYIYPIVSEKTRTGKVRLEVTSGGRSLRPGMYATVTLEEPGASAVTIPENALLDGGETKYVFVVIDSTHFVPRTVTVGRRGTDRIEIVAGVTAGETVVTNANFLIDSESRLKAAITGMSTQAPAEHQR